MSLLSKPTFRKYSFEAMVKRKDKHHEKPVVTYEFSNSRKFLDTDRSENGFYKRS